MRLTCILTISAAALLFCGCAAEVPPPPPAQPVIEGQVDAVTRADIRTVIGLAKQRLAETERSSHPIYKIHVESRRQIYVYHGRLPTPHDTVEEFLIFERVKGHWELGEREVVRGSNIPT